MTDITFKLKVNQACQIVLRDKINLLNASLSDLRESSRDHGKSSAGDKHETTAALAHIGQEQLARQLHELNIQLSIIARLANAGSTLNVCEGSLVETTRGIFYIAAALGKVPVGNKDVMVISPVSPLGQSLAGTSAGSKVHAGQLIHEVLSVV